MCEGHSTLNFQILIIVTRKWTRKGTKKENRKVPSHTYIHIGGDHDFFGEMGDSDSSSSFGSTASLINEMVLSRLRRLVLGLVMVVPRLAVLMWPRLGGCPVTGIVGNVAAGAGDMGLPPPVARTFSRAAETFLIGTGDVFSSDGDGGFDIIARPSCESASYSSGGRRSFSISDLRLQDSISISRQCIRFFGPTHHQSS